ncbi:unnamed protein product [Choristocarpus tenellus]
MTEFIVGQRVRVRPRVGDAQEGVVYTLDSATNTLTIKQEIPHTTTHCSILVFNRSFIEVDAIGGDEGGIDPDVALPSVSEQDLERKEARAVKDAAKAWAQINGNASKAGQTLFDAFAKTLECEWDRESIVVLGSVKINPPYQPSSCSSLDGDKQGMDRVLLMAKGRSLNAVITSHTVLLVPNYWQLRKFQELL